MYETMANTRDETVRDETIEKWAGSHDLPRSTGIQASRSREPVTGGHPVVAFVAPHCRCSPRGSGVHA